MDVCVCAHTHMSMHAHVYIIIIKGLPQLFPIVFLEAGPLTEPKDHQFSQTTRSVNPRDPSVSTFTVLELQAHPVFYTGSGDSNSGLNAYMQGTS